MKFYFCSVSSMLQSPFYKVTDVDQFGMEISQVSVSTSFTIDDSGLSKKSSRERGDCERSCVISASNKLSSCSVESKP